MSSWVGGGARLVVGEEEEVEEGEEVEEEGEEQGERGRS